MTVRKKTWYNFAQPENNADVLDIDIFEEIGYWGITLSDFKADLKPYGNVSTINLVISSPGGEVFDGFAIYNLLKSHSATVVVTVLGYAASISSLIAMAGDSPPKMYKNTRLMIHPASMWSGGTVVDLRKDADLLESLEEDILDGYLRFANISREAISAAMAAETWYTAEEALAIGLASEVIDDDADVSQITNMTQYNFKNIPKNMLVSITNKKEPYMPIEKPIDKATPSPQPVDTDTIKNDAITAERCRAASITAKAKILNVSASVVDKLIEDGVSVEDAYSQLIAEVGKNATTVPSIVAIVGADEQEKQHNVIVNALRVAGGAKVDQKIKSDVLAADLPRSVMALARRELVNAGVSNVHMMDNNRVYENLIGVIKNAAGGTGDFTSILADTINKGFAKGYNESAETYRIFTNDISVSDFKQYSQVKLSTFSDVELINEGAPFKDGALSDAKEVATLQTFGKSYSLTRQSIVNDDLGVFVRVPERIGRSVERKKNRDVYDALFDNAAMTEDSIALFNSAHNNYVASGSGAVPSKTTLDAGVEAMMKQKLLKGEKSQADTFTNVPPQFIIAPVALRSNILPIVRSQFDPSDNKNMAYNDFGPSGDNNLKPVFDAYLDSKRVTGWYLAANGNLVDTISIINLNGVTTPTLRSRPSDVGEALGIRWDVYLDWAVLVGDFRGLYFNFGA